MRGQARDAAGSTYAVAREGIGDIARGQARDAPARQLTRLTRETTSAYLSVAESHHLPTRE